MFLEIYEEFLDWVLYFRSKGKIDVRSVEKERHIKYNTLHRKFNQMALDGVLNKVKRDSIPPGGVYYDFELSERAKDSLIGNAKRILKAFEPPSMASPVKGGRALEKVEKEGPVKASREPSVNKELVSEFLENITPEIADLLQDLIEDVVENSSQPAELAPERFLDSVLTRIQGIVKEELEQQFLP